MFMEEYSAVLEANDARSIEREAARFTSRLGFSRYSLFVRHDDLLGERAPSTPLTIGNSPPDFAEFDPDQTGGSLDPVMQHLKRSSRPIAYNQDTYTCVGMGHLWEYQAPFGYAFGIGTVAHLPGNLHVAFGIDCGAPPPRSHFELTSLLAETQLFTTLVQDVAVDIVGRSGAANSAVIRLSPREQECLKWAAEGKTAWETSVILALAEGSVAKILSSAIRKLNCSSKPQAVVRALRLKLIH